jgi:Fe-S oxidoreductase
VGRKILDLRRGLVSEGRITNEKVVQLFTTMERAPHNPWGLSQDARQKFIEAKEFPVYDGSQSFLFWMGCQLSFDAHGHQVALAMKRILDAAGVSWGVLKRESCCGEPARRAGNEYQYLQLADAVTESLRTEEVKNIITCCPHCATMFDKDYRQIGSYAALNIRVMHHTEAIAMLLPRIPVERSLETMSFHDPCYLARHRGITQAPRKVLRHCGISIREMSPHGKDTFCCGAGGSQFFITDDRSDCSAERVNQHRFGQATATQTQAIAVACPYCSSMLKEAAVHARRDDIAVLDIAEIVASHLGVSHVEHTSAQRM